MGDDFILEARGIARSFAGFYAVKDVDLKISRGSIHALIGPNGAGKTTCFNLLTRFLPLSRGQIVYDGKDISATRPADVAQMGLIRSFQISAVFTHMSARDNVRVALQRHRGGNFDFWRSCKILDQYHERASALLDAVGLSKFADESAGEMSYGRKRALEIATTLAMEPKLMLLDEPMAGLGQEDIERITQLIKKIADGRTILMVEHNLKVVAHLCDKITVLTRGEVLAQGDYETVSSNPAVKHAYIGAGDD